MTLSNITGADLIDLANDKLSGYSNAVDGRALLSYLNEGKDAVWEILKANNDDFFTAFSQATIPAGLNYFAPLLANVREYTLPDNFREMRFIECTTPSYELTKWTYKKPSDPEFRLARQSGTAAGASGNNQSQEFFYTYVGQQLVLAMYPPTTLTAILWYTIGLPDFEYSDPIPEIMWPYSKSIATYASKAVMLNADDAKFAAWKSEWKDSVVSTSQNSAPRNQADPIFVEDFGGY